jgi:hypothetical protein
MAREGETIQHYASRNDIIVIRADKIQCNQGKCGYFHDGAPLFADDSHLAQDALPLFRGVFETALQNAFAHTSRSSPEFR